jgi:hypothetical protein
MRLFQSQPERSSRFGTPDYLSFCWMKEKRANLKTKVSNANTWGAIPIWWIAAELFADFRASVMFAFSHSDTSGTNSP